MQRTVGGRRSEPEMPLKPRLQLEDSFLAGRACAVCGANALRVVRLSGMPDHVACGECASAFVVEDGGDRVMYGKIPAEYPITRRFALRQWAWLEAIERKAAEERPARPPEPPPDWVAAPAPQDGVGETEAGFAGIPESEQESAAAPADRRPTIPLPSGAEVQAEAQLPGWLAAPAYPEMEEAPEKPRPPSIFKERIDSFREVEGAVEVKPEPPSPPAPRPPSGAPPPKASAPKMEPAPAAPIEPPAGARYRVYVKGEVVEVPQGVCAHCLRSPAPGRLRVVRRWPAGPSAGKPLTFSVPLCAHCRKRAGARSEAEKTGRLQAHLISALIGVILIVAALVFGLVDPQTDLLINLVLIALLLLAGYGLTATILLGRASRYPPPPDAAFVRTTLQVPLKDDSLEIPFDWRNPRYAERFLQANRDRVVGQMIPMQEPSASPDRPR